MGNNKFPHFKFFESVQVRCSKCGYPDNVDNKESVCVKCGAKHGEHSIVRINFSKEASALMKKYTMEEMDYFRAFIAGKAPENGLITGMSGFLCKKFGRI